MSISEALSTFIVLALVCNTLDTNVGNALKNSETINITEQLNERQKIGLHIHHRWLQCLVTRQMAFTLTKFQTKAIAFLMSEGQRLTLNSWLCILPDQSEQVAVRWKFLALDGAALEFLDDNERHFVHEDSKSLEITDVETKDTGFYFANVNYEYDSAVYFLEVSEADQLEPVSEPGLESTHVPTEHILEARNLRIALQMDEWTQCSECGRTGIRHRVGRCMVEQYKDGPVRPIHHPILDMFIGGLPCRSAFLPRELKDLPEVKRTKSIYIRGPCKVPCISEIPSSTDKSGRHSNDSSRKSKLFARVTNILQHSFMKKTIIQVKNSAVIIICPRRNKFGTHVEWRKDGAALPPETTRMQSRGRITIDHIGRIRIQRLRTEDSGVYSCWMSDHASGTVTLHVKDRFVPPVHLAALLPLLTYTLILTAIVVLGCKLWMNRSNENIA